MEIIRSGMKLTGLFGKGTNSLRKAVVRGDVGCNVSGQAAKGPSHPSPCGEGPAAASHASIASVNFSYSQMQAGVYIYTASCPCGVLVGRDFIIIKNMFLFHYIITTYYSLIYFLTQPRGLYCCTSRSLTSNIFNLLSY